MALGGNVALVTSGSAPLVPHVLDFLRVVLSCTFLQGRLPFYDHPRKLVKSLLGCGMTENYGTCTRYISGDPTDGSVGFMQPVNEMEPVDVSSVCYTSEDKPYPRGGVCVRGANCFSGYYKSKLHRRTNIRRR